MTYKELYNELGKYIKGREDYPVEIYSRQVDNIPLHDFDFWGEEEGTPRLVLMH